HPDRSAELVRVRGWVVSLGQTSTGNSADSTVLAPAVSVNPWSTLPVLASGSCSMYDRMRAIQLHRGPAVKPQQPVRLPCEFVRLMGRLAPLRGRVPLTSW